MVLSPGRYNKATMNVSLSKDGYWHRDCETMSGGTDEECVFPTGDRREGVRCALSKMLDRRIVGDVFWIACAGPVSRKPCCCRRDGNHQAETRLFQEYVQPRRADAGPQFRLRRSLGDTHSVAESTEHTDTLVNQIKSRGEGGSTLARRWLSRLRSRLDGCFAVVFLQAQRQCSCA